MSNPVIKDNGDQYWYQNDLIHRDNDLPAIVCANGNKFWYKNGLMHQETIEEVNWIKEGF